MATREPEVAGKVLARTSRGLPGDRFCFDRNHDGAHEKAPWLEHTRRAVLRVVDHQTVISRGTVPLIALCRRTETGFAPTGRIVVVYEASAFRHAAWINKPAEKVET